MVEEFSQLCQSLGALFIILCRPGWYLDLLEGFPVNIAAGGIAVGTQRSAEVGASLQCCTEHPFRRACNIAHLSGTCSLKPSQTYLTFLRRSET